MIPAILRMTFCVLNIVNVLVMNSFNLKSFREENNISQKQLAEYLSVSIRAVQSWEQGQRNIPHSVIKLIELYKNEHKIVVSSPVESYGCVSCTEKDKEIKRLKDEIIRLQAELLNEVRKTNAEGAPGAGAA